MTRRDQTIRAWIERPTPRHRWQSCVSCAGTQHRIATHTRLRKAAIEFNRHHAIQILKQLHNPAKPTPTPTQPHLIPPS